MKTTVHPSPALDSAPERHPAPVNAIAATGAIEARALFGKRRELMIEHAGFSYRLRITQNNKLILTK